MTVSRLMRDVIEFCYPSACSVCRNVAEEGAFLCPTCLGQLEKLEAAGACELCGMPAAHKDAPCPFCKGEGVPHYRQILRLGTFDAPLKELIHQFKYHRRWSLGEQLAERLLGHGPVQGMLADADVLVPVPLHFVRQFWRGYNQAGIIARHLSKKVGVPTASPLRRVRNTETQTQLSSRAKRFKNLQGAFALVRPEAIRGKRVVVVDDVMTTEATLQTVARALRPAKPASLGALVLAVADPRGRAFQYV
ncbi:MAG TPA: ComF family protein [Tepidisphaeraceae bacterium]|nr:ComF family protein [Tepidisphaeraceae bacterium]